MKANQAKLLLLLPFLLFGLAACGDDDDSTDDTQKPQNEQNNGNDPYEIVKDKTIDDEDDNNDNDDNDDNDNDDIIIDNTLNFFCLTAEEDNVSITLEGNLTDKTIKYSLDKNTWKDYARAEDITLDDGEMVFFVGDNPDGWSSQGNVLIFETSGRCSASGDLMSLIDYTLQTTDIPCDYCFAQLFNGCKGLMSTPLLSAGGLSKYCYYRMFEGCTLLQNVSDLHSRSAQENCYEAMFRGCSSLETPPELSLQYLAANCCTSMFENCTSLKASPELLADQLVESCYCRMFKGCTNLQTITINFTEWSNTSTVNWTEGIAGDGIFVCPEDLTEKTDKSGNYIPQNWSVKYK